MKSLRPELLVFGWLLSLSGWSQPPVQPLVRGFFLTDTIEIGRPFRYSLTYRHSPKVDVLFPDTATYFLPYRVQKVDIFTTQTTTANALAISRDSAVYTLLSFETDSTQLLRVPIRIINDIDCTALWTKTDTVFLRSKLPPLPRKSTRLPSFLLATETELAPLQQQFNYSALIKGLLGISLTAFLLYGIFGRLIRQQWRLYQLNRRHIRFLRNYNQLAQRLNSVTVSEITNQAIVMWKMYLERLERQPYIALTTSELAERINDKQVTNALREADRMIYGGAFSSHSQPALYALRDMATQAYYRVRTRLQVSEKSTADNEEQLHSDETSSLI